MANNEKIETIMEIRKKTLHLKNVQEVHKESLTTLDKLALFITQRVGTMGFFFAIVTWTALWLGWNMFAPQKFRFDPFPGFVLWLFISNMIQIFLMPLIMIGQNIQGKYADLRSEHDYYTDKKAEKEVEAILLHLEHQQNLLLEILAKIETLEKEK